MEIENIKMKGSIYKGKTFGFLINEGIHYLLKELTFPIMYHKTSNKLAENEILYFGYGSKNWNIEGNIDELINNFSRYDKECFYITCTNEGRTLKTRLPSEVITKIVENLKAIEEKNKVRNFINLQKLNAEYNDLDFLMREQKTLLLKHIEADLYEIISEHSTPINALAERQKTNENYKIHIVNNKQRSHEN